MEYVEFLSENAAWLLLSVALGCSALFGLHFLCSELLVACHNATCAMLSPVRLYHSEYSRVRVDLPQLNLVRFEWPSPTRLEIRVLWLNASLAIIDAETEFVNGSLCVRSGGY